MLLRKGMITLRPRLDPELLRFGYLLARAGRGDSMLTGLRALRDQGRASIEIYSELATRSPAMGLRRAGLMNVCSTAKGFESLVEEADLLGREGFRLQLLEGGAASNLEPAVRPDIPGAVLWEEDANVVPEEAIAALAEAATTAGARIELGAAVSGFERDGGGAISAVLVGKRRLPARTVVLAAGASTSALARRLGARVPLQPGKGHHLHLADWPARPATPLIFHEHAMAATAMGAGLRLTGGMDFVGKSREVSSRRIDDIVRLSQDYLLSGPTAADAATGRQWCGLRPCSPDGLPIVGWMKSAPNALLATGHGMLGLTLGPATGCDVANLVLGDPSRQTTWQRHYSPARFGI
jgi:D-amino-acid dehydrogenase